MMLDLGDLFTASSAFLVWCCGVGLVFVVLRFVRAWADPEWKWPNRFIAYGILTGCIAGGIHQGDSMYLWAVDFFTPASLRWSTWGYRIFGIQSFLAIGGGLAYLRCGHRGWIGMIAGGLLFSAAVVAVSKAGWLS